MEFSERAVVLRSGTCPSCAKEFAYVEGTTLTGHLPEGSESEAATPVGAPVVVAGDGPECPTCGGPLEIQTGREGALIVRCEDCETQTVYRPEGERGPRERRGPRPEGRRPEPDFESRSRPCRKCGAPLRFTTGEDGMLVGECDSCGNRFTLPPRRDSGGAGGYRGRPAGDRGGYRGRGGSRPYFQNRRRPAYGGASRRSRDDDSDSDERRDRRRRPRRDD